jgi:hypothetical protein
VCLKFTKSLPAYWVGDSAWDYVLGFCCGVFQAVGNVGDWNVFVGGKGRLELLMDKLKY